MRFVQPSGVAISEASPDLVRPDFHAVFQAHVSYVWHALRRLGIREADVEDVAHEVFLQVYRNLNDYDPARPIRPWLFGFVFRKASDYRRLARSRFEIIGISSAPQDMAPSALDQVLQQEALAMGELVMNKIELKQRAVFILHELDGYPMPEVARALQIPLNTAYSRLRLARATFEKLVQRLRLNRGDP